MRGLWLGSNELSADIQNTAPTRVVSFAAAEPLDAQGAFNRTRLKEVEESIATKGLRGLLLTPPYGHYYANDRRVYPFDVRLPTDSIRDGSAQSMRSSFSRSSHSLTRSGRFTPVAAGST